MSAGYHRPRFKPRKGNARRTYNRYDYLDQKRKALDAWAERVAFIAGDAAMPTTWCRSVPDGAVMSALPVSPSCDPAAARLSTADAGHCQRRRSGSARAFLSGRTDDIDIDPLEDCACAWLAVSQLLGDARPTSVH